MHRAAIAVRIAHAAAVLAALAPQVAAASSFNVAPIRIEMDREHPTGVLTLHSDSDAPVTVQVQAVSWSQADGEDAYQPTRELLVTPPVFVVAPNGEQIVRVARRGAASDGVERAYRVFFEEVPATAQPGFNGLKVALRIGLPVFVATPARASAELEWQARWQADGTLSVAVANRGTAHVQVTYFELTGPDATVIARVAGSRYVLPGSRTRWTVTPAAGTERGAVLRLRGSSDRGAISADIATARP